MNILIASENSAYAVGGAEHSLFSFASDFVSTSDSLSIMCDQRSGYAKLPFTEIAVGHVKTHELSTRFGWLKKPLPYLYAQLFFLFNFKTIYSQVLNADLILTQNRWYPYIALLASIHKRFNKGANDLKLYIFVRDEKCLGVYRCYKRSLIDRFFWKIKYFGESPFRILHDQLGKRAFNTSKVYYNSNFMKKLSIENGYKPKEYEVCYPKVKQLDIEMLKNVVFELGGVYAFLYKCRERNVLLIGDEYVKGIDTFFELSRKHPRLNFVVVGKSVSQATHEANVIKLPWSSIYGLPYLLAETLLVPSIWLEAFGRVAIEAQQLGLVIVVAEIGGLVEAIDGYQKGYVARRLGDYSCVLSTIEKQI